MMAMQVPMVRTMADRAAAVQSAIQVALSSPKAALAHIGWVQQNLTFHADADGYYPFEDYSSTHSVEGNLMMRWYSTAADDGLTRTGFTRYVYKSRLTGASGYIALTKACSPHI
jgi:hypothetical protein